MGLLKRSPRWVRLQPIEGKPGLYTYGEAELRIMPSVLTDALEARYGIVGNGFHPPKGAARETKVNKGT